MLAEVRGEVMKNAGAGPDEFRGLQHDLTIVHAKRCDGIIRVKGRVQARPGKNDATALAARLEVEELVVRGLWLLRRSCKVILVQNDESGGVPRIIDPGKVELGLPVIVKVSGLEVVEVPAVPVLMQQPAIGCEQNDLGGVIQVVRRGGQHHVAEAGSNRRDQETSQGRRSARILRCWSGRVAGLRTATVRRHDSRSKSAVYFPVRRSAGGVRTGPRYVHRHPDRRPRWHGCEFRGVRLHAADTGGAFASTLVPGRPTRSRCCVPRGTRLVSPGQKRRAWNREHDEGEACYPDARRHQARADGRRRASMMAATGSPQESSGVAGDDAGGRVSVVCSAPERFQASSSATVAITRPRPPGRRCTGSARSCSQICAVRSPTPRYAAISFHEESSPSGNSTNSNRMLAHGATARN